jgi:4-hydroxy-tetrahydrodipicolinate synthase
MKKFYGTGVALVTPFTETLEVDYKSLKKILKHTAKGVDYYVVMGTTGEATTCSEEEKNEVLQFIKENNPQKLPIVYGIGGNDTSHVLESITGTDFTGIDAILSVSPYYNKPSQEGICQHFETIAGKSPVPLVLYNIPGRTSSNMTAETTLRLASHSNIIGIKEASGNLEQCMKIAKSMPKDFLLLSGDDLWTAALYAMGGQGVISVLANAFPLTFKKTKENAFAGKHVAAFREISKLSEINGPMYEEGNPVGIKYLLSLMGLCTPHVRLPLVKASKGLEGKIAALYTKK